MWMRPFDAQVTGFRYECMGSVALEVPEQDSNTRYSG